MKKIGLVTVTYIDNFGSHLQSFALQETLKSLGYDVEIIDYNGVKNEVETLRRKYLLSRLFCFSELKAYYPKLKRKIVLKFNKRFRKNHFKRKQKYQEFCANYNFSKKADGFKGLTELCNEEYSAVIVGSDQNWRPANIAGRYYTLGFVPDDVNKISYSTSFGINKVIDKQKKYARWFLSRINYLSVREESGKRIIKDLTTRDAEVVCDPTLLLSADKWNDFIGNGRVVDDKYVLCYFLGTSDEGRKFAVELKKKTGIKVVAILNGEKYYKERIRFYDEEINDIGPFEFAKLVRDAEYVCTDSFHGCAFSLIFGKQFFPFYKFTKNGKMSTNSRLDTMLDWAGVGKGRILKKGYDFNGAIENKIDYSVVGKNVKNMVDKSYDFLQNAIEQGKTDE